MADTVRILHLSGGPISLDVKFDEDRALRQLLPIGGAVDLTGIATLDEARRAEQLLHLEADGRIQFELAADDPTTRQQHLFIVTPARSTPQPGQGPQPAAYGNLIVLEFTLDLDAAFRVVKIPSSYTGNATAHVHWTKSQTTDQSTKVVRWRIDYTVVNGRTEDGAAAGSTILLDDSYDDAGTTTHIVHRTANISLPGLVAGYYLLVKISAVTPPTGTALVEPALMSMDILYDEKINE
jgi:hypothetical protein